MGKRPAEIEREIADQREIISRRIEEMRERGSRDAEEFSSRLGDALNGSVVKQTVEERPMLTLAGALAFGVALGMASESVSLRDVTGQGDGRSSQGRSGGGGLFGSLGAIAADELKAMLDRWTAERRSADGTSARQPSAGETIPSQAVVDEQDAVGRLI